MTEDERDEKLRFNIQKLAKTRELEQRVESLEWDVKELLEQLQSKS